MNLRRTVESFRKGILGKRDPDLMCFAVCAPMEAYLCILGIDVRMVHGEFDGQDHCWLERGDGTVIDPTISQFSGQSEKFPNVYIGLKLPQYSYESQAA